MGQANTGTNQKGTEELLDTSYRKEAIEIMEKFSKLKHEDVAKSYDFLIQHNFFNATGKLSKKKLTALAEALGDIQGSTDLARFVLPGITDIVN